MQVRVGKVGRGRVVISGRLQHPAVCKAPEHPGLGLAAVRRGGLQSHRLQTEPLRRAARAQRVRGGKGQFSAGAAALQEGRRTSHAGW